MIVTTDFAPPGIGGNPYTASIQLTADNEVDFLRLEALAAFIDQYGDLAIEELACYASARRDDGPLPGPPTSFCSCARVELSDVELVGGSHRGCGLVLTVEGETVAEGLKRLKEER